MLWWIAQNTISGAVIGLIGVTAWMSGLGSPSLALSATRVRDQGFDRRLSMIMCQRTPCRTPALAWAAVGLLTLAAVPGFSQAVQLSQLPEVPITQKRPGAPKTDTFGSHLADYEIFLGRGWTIDDGGVISQDGLQLLNKQIVSTIYSGNVKMIHWTNGKEASSSRSMPPDYMLVQCNNLEVSRQTVHGKLVLKLKACGQVVVEGENYKGECQTLQYDQTKEQIILQSEAGMAQLKHHVPGSEASRLSAKRLQFDLKTGMLCGDGVGSISISK